MSDSTFCIDQRENRRRRLTKHTGKAHKAASRAVTAAFYAAVQTESPTKVMKIHHSEGLDQHLDSTLSPHIQIESSSRSHLTPQLLNASNRRRFDSRMKTGRSLTLRRHLQLLKLTLKPFQRPSQQADLHLCCFL